jgi:protein-S-isoprenylcysteine O-methyltransferase
MSTLADLAWLAFVVVWAIGTFTNKRTVRRWEPGPLILHVAVLALAFNLFFNHFLRRGWLGEQLLPGSDWLDYAGSAMQIAGLTFCIWARLHIGRNWSGMVTLKEGHTLVRTGPYGIVRHPIYSGLLLAFLGMAVDHGDLAGLSGFLVLVVEWKRKSLVEERLMVEQFGEEYKRYRAEVKGLVPMLW